VDHFAIPVWALDPYAVKQGCVGPHDVPYHACCTHNGNMFNLTVLQQCCDKQPGHAYCTLSCLQHARDKSKIQKPLHAPTRNRQLTIPPMLAKRSKPMVVCACNNPNRRGCSRTMQGIVMGAAQMLTQGFDNCTDLQDRDSAPVKRHGQSCVHADVISQILDPTLVDPYAHKGRRYTCPAAAAVIQRRMQVMQSFAVTFDSGKRCLKMFWDLMRCF